SCPLPVVMSLQLVVDRGLHLAPKPHHAAAGKIPTDGFSQQRTRSTTASARGWLASAPRSSARAGGKRPMMVAKPGGDASGHCPGVDLSGENSDIHGPTK